MTDRDAIVIGSGPNGLAAAITLARAGRSVRVLEAASTPGGGARSASLTRPGFVHDVCSAIHPVVAGSPFFWSLGLDRIELDLIEPPSPVAHPLDDGTAVLLERSVEDTAIGLGPDADAYRRLLTPLVRDWRVLVGELLGPLRLPRHPVIAGRFGWLAHQSLTWERDKAAQPSQAHGHLPCPSSRRRRPPRLRQVTAPTDGAPADGGAPTVPRATRRSDTT